MHTICCRTWDGKKLHHIIYSSCAELSIMPYVILGARSSRWIEPVVQVLHARDRWMTAATASANISTNHVFIPRDAHRVHYTTGPKVYMIDQKLGNIIPAVQQHAVHQPNPQFASVLLTKPPRQQS